MSENDEGQEGFTIIGSGDSYHPEHKCHTCRRSLLAQRYYVGFNQADGSESYVCWRCMERAYTLLKQSILEEPVERHIERLKELKEYPHG